MTDPTTPAPVRKSAGFWTETWRRFVRRKEAVAALMLVVGLALVALLSPAIAGTKPIVCRYKGQLYFPALSYFNESWENPIFQKDKFRKRYPLSLPKKDPQSWAIWPLVYQDPYRRVRDGEWQERPGTTDPQCLA